MRLSHLIEEINEQLVITANNSTISDIEDLLTIRTDNYMSIADSKYAVQETPKHLIDDNLSRQSSIRN